MSKKTPLAAFGAAKKNLTNKIINSHNYLGYGAPQWFEWMIDDCLASMGKRLSQPWSDDQNSLLFDLGGLYAQTVIENPFSDVLGAIYQELASGYGKKRMGQYFTPDSIAECMAMMQLDKADLDAKKIITVCEPCVGSGTMLLAFFRVALSYGSHYLQKISVTGIDLDQLCVKIATLQILANNLLHNGNLGEIVMLRGNSLGDPKDLTTFYHASTPSYDALCVTDLIQIEDDIEQVVELDDKADTRVETLCFRKQMSIFDINF